MKYSLAKKLKDAGFPQDLHEQEDAWDWVNEKPEKMIFPTLSELIEACGDEMEYLLKGFKNSKWYAGKKVQLGMIIEGEGPSPEEAVAKLWLELNKK